LSTFNISISKATLDKSVIKFSPVADISPKLRDSTLPEQENLFSKNFAIPLIVRRHNAQCDLPLYQIDQPKDWPQGIEIHFHHDSYEIQNKDAFDRQFCDIVTKISGKECFVKK
jgi:hypothetical protein